MAASLNLTMDQGASYTLNLVVNKDDTTPKDLTGYTGIFQCANIDSDTKVLEVTSTTSPDKITITNAKKGEIELFIKIVTLDALFLTDVNKEKYDYYYTFEIVDSNNIVTRLLDGLVAVSKGVL